MLQLYRLILQARRDRRRFCLILAIVIILGVSFAVLGGLVSRMKTETESRHGANFTGTAEDTVGIMTTPGFQWEL